MEDDPDREGEDLIEKFDRLLRQRVTDIAGGPAHAGPPRCQRLLR
jgi:hypothetical protein